MGDKLSSSSKGLTTAPGFGRWGWTSKAELSKFLMTRANHPLLESQTKSRKCSWYSRACKWLINPSWKTMMLLVTPPRLNQRLNRRKGCTSKNWIAFSMLDSKQFFCQQQSSGHSWYPTWQSEYLPTRTNCLRTRPTRAKSGKLWGTQMLL